MKFHGKLTALLLVATLSLVSSCASLSFPTSKLGDGKVGDLDLTNSLDDFLVKLRTFAAADVLQAYELATKSNDQVASICWQVTYLFLQSKPVETGDSTGSSTTGLATIIQSVRNAKTKVDSGVPTELRVACAALYNDIRRDALAIAAMAASRGTVSLPRP